jgi:hypothetical protein
MFYLHLKLMLCEWMAECISLHALMASHHVPEVEDGKKKKPDSSKFELYQ